MLCKLAHKAESLAVDALLEALAAARPPAAVEAKMNALSSANRAVTSALDELTAPQRGLDEARTARDALIPDWAKMLRQLKDSAKVAYRDVAGRAASLFADPLAVQAHARGKKKPPKKAPGAPQPAAGSAPQVPAAAKRKKKGGRRR
jgi:hypothetical protein